MTEFIGSRISLISKRDIRYVGILHEINSDSSTVALEKVVSYGTEGRRPDDEVPPALENIYEYIVFRGSDVKDLRIEEGPKDGAASRPNVPDDPAIIGNSRKPGAVQSQQAGAGQQPRAGAPANQPPLPPQGQQQEPPGGFPPHNMPYGFNPNQRFNGPSPQGYPSGPYPYPPPPPYSGAPPGWYPPPQGFPPMHPGQFPPRMPPGAPGQRGPMPHQQAPGMPTPSDSAAPAEEHQFPKPEEKASGGAKMQASSGTPIPLQEAPSGPSPGSVPLEDKIQAKVLPTGPKGTRIVPAVPVAGPKGVATANGGGTNKSIDDANRDARAAVAAAMAKLPAAGGQKAPNDDGTIDNLTRKVGEMRTHEHARNARGQAISGSYRGGRGGSFRGGRQGNKIEIPTTDYDFDAANAKFNKQELVKEAIASGSPINTPADEEPVEADLPGNGARKGSTDTGAAAALYNKSTSFFDDISSEIKDRAESHETGQRLGGREFRNEERQKNMETFGQGSVDNGYRYRGRGRGRGRGGYGRGRGGGRGAPRGRGATAIDA